MIAFRKRNRYQECLRTGLSRDEWLAVDDRKKTKRRTIEGKSWSLPPPYNRKSPKGYTEKKMIYDANMAYMKKVCGELVAIDVGGMAKGGYNMEGVADSFGSVDGIAFYCEFKRPGNVISSAQMAHLKAWAKEGHASIVVASPDGFYRWHRRERPVGIVNGIGVY